MTINFMHLKCIGRQTAVCYNTETQSEAISSAKYGNTSEAFKEKTIISIRGGNESENE